MNKITTLGLSAIVHYYKVMKTKYHRVWQTN